MSRRALLMFVGTGAACLLPWTVYLAQTLPDRHGSSGWKVAWVGFDTGLLLLFAAATVLGLRRRRAAVPLLVATAALLCADAWFDVVLDWDEPDRWVSVAMALLLELPVAVLLLLHQRIVLAAGMPVRRLTVHDIELREDPTLGRVMAAVRDHGPVTADALADRIGLDPGRVEAALTRAANAGYARRTRDGAWRTGGPLDLRLPRLDDVPVAERARFAAHLDALFDRESRLLAWAAAHRDEFGEWAAGERAIAHLTAAELARFEDEYRELVNRYCVLRADPAAGTREIAVRLYAFPHPGVRQLG